MIALCDMNSFYASVELIFRPDLTHRKVCVLSNNDGCIVALTPEAQACGVQKFTPYFQQKKLIKEQGITVFSSNYTNYGHVSDRIMKTLSEQSPTIEVYSIDEAFLGVDGIGDLKAYGAQLVQRIKREQCIQMGVGIAPTKTLAKLANHASKKIIMLNHVCVADTEKKYRWLLDRASTSDVWGIGKGLSSRLAKHGVYTASELAAMPDGRARQIGGVVLERLVNELNGVSCLELELIVQDKKEIVSSKSFGTKTNDLAAIKSATASYVARAAQKLRSQNLHARYLAVSLQTSRHVESNQRYFNSYGEALPHPTDNTTKLTNIALRFLEKIYKPEFTYSKSSVRLIDLSPSHVVQADLFEPYDNTDDLMTVFDAINNRFGRDSIRSAIQSKHSKLTMNSDYRSPHYFTQWSDIPRVKCA